MRRAIARHFSSKPSRRLPVRRIDPAQPHESVLLQPVLQLCTSPNPHAWLIDGTLGAAGHSRALLQKHPGWKLLGVDRDPDALELARERLGPDLSARSIFLNANYDVLGPSRLTALGLPDGGADVLLFDLGLSSMQLDRAERGFAFRLRGPLDMRMAGSAREEKAAPGEVPSFLAVAAAQREERQRQRELQGRRALGEETEGEEESEAEAAEEDEESGEEIEIDTESAYSSATPPPLVPFDIPSLHAKAIAARSPRHAHVESGPTALELIDVMDEATLADVIYYYGGERRSRQIAAAIKAARHEGRLETTVDLEKVVFGAHRKSGRYKKLERASRQPHLHPATQTFQALRIAVNDEMGSLERLLSRLPTIMRPGARVGIISFHSLEHKMVRQALKHWHKQQDPTYHLSLITRQPVLPSREERSANPRARSARLHVAEKPMTSAES